MLEMILHEPRALWIKFNGHPRSYNPAPSLRGSIIHCAIAMPWTIQPFLMTLDVVKAHAIRAVEKLDPVSCGIIGCYLSVGVFNEDNGRSSVDLPDQLAWLAHGETIPLSLRTGQERTDRKLDFRMISVMGRPSITVKECLELASPVKYSDSMEDKLVVGFMTQLRDGIEV